MTLTVLIPIDEGRASVSHGCEQAASVAEREAGLPSGLLQAIGRVESGRWDRLREQISGWPLSVNAGQRGDRFSTIGAAVDYVEGELASGEDLVDIGCFQIDLHYHPNAFADWREGFDPDVNALAASRILQALHARTGDWNQTIALYHSADPERGMRYLAAVQRAWTTGLGSDVAAFPEQPDPFTVLSSADASRIAVWAPAGIQSRLARRGPRLPVVITP